MLYTVQDTTMTALGDAIRKQVGDKELVVERPALYCEYHFDSKDYNLAEWGNINTQWFALPLADTFGSDTLNDYYLNFLCYIDYKSTDTWTPNISVSFGYVNAGSISEDLVDFNEWVSSKQYEITVNKGVQKKVKDCDIGIKLEGSQALEPIEFSFDVKIWAIDQSTGNYIGKRMMTPAKMVDTIDTMVVMPSNRLIFTGSCADKFSGTSGWGWFPVTFNSNIKTENITDISNMFKANSQIQELNFEINGTTSSSVSMDSAFYQATNLTNCLKLNIPYRVGYMQNIFSQCWRLREIKDDDWNINNYYGHSSSSNRDGNIFYACYSLRRITEKLLKNVWNLNTSSSRSAYYYTFTNNYVLDEINKLGVSTATYTSNMFTSTFSNCSRIKDLTFDKNDDGTVKTAKWSNQSIDLSSYVGYASASGKSYITGYNSGITADTKVTDDATYQALKNDPDYWTMSVDYSRYNHDSAVNTINSLPDCSSSGGTNIIKFKGQCGALTDGGAINTLTEEEIAIASAKAWTVSLV